MAIDQASRRDSPLALQLILLGLFLVLAVVGVFTVFLPEIADDSNEEAPVESPGSGTANANGASGDR
jgi:flagellar basal body-associated protein FliL